jgi:hypothetical protein
MRVSGWIRQHGGWRIGVGGVVGNIPDAVWVAGGTSGVLSVIFPTQFGWRACWRVVGNIPDAVWVAGGTSGGSSVIFPTQFGWRACWRVVGNIPDAVCIPPQKQLYTMVICLDRMDSVFSLISDTFWMVPTNLKIVGSKDTGCMNQMTDGYINQR